MVSDVNVSVVVPIYNVETWLDDCLLSIRAQTFPNYEIIIVNDGSTDGSIHRARAHAALDERIRIVEQENRGLGGARNTGLAHSSGEFLVFVDSDDFVSERFLETLITAQNKTKSDVVSCSHAKISVDALFVNYEKKSDCLRSDGVPLSDYEKVLGVFVGSVAWGRLFKREHILKSKIRFPHKIPHEDLFFTYKVLRDHGHVALDDCLYFWRQRSNSLGNSLSATHLSVPWRLREDTYSFLKACSAKEEEYVLAARRNLIFLNALWTRALEGGSPFLSELEGRINDNKAEIEEDLRRVGSSELRCLASQSIRVLRRRLEKLLAINVDTGRLSAGRESELLYS